jgi:hypothetical protein
MKKKKIEREIKKTVCDLKKKKKKKEKKNYEREENEKNN